MSNGTTPEARQEHTDEERARRHLAVTAEVQRRRRGAIEAVSVPRTRKLGRRVRLVGVWTAGILGAGWRRISDSHKVPGRWGRRVLLFRPYQLVSRWVLLWIAVAVGCSVYLATGEPWGNLVDWGFRWCLGGAVAALVAIVWHDLVKSPHTARLARRRIIEDPEALLRPTLAEPQATTVELEPPVNTVPRDDLYDELLPGVINRKKEVQIVVGGPGAGKTTALIDLGAVLAKIGLVPVLVELRDERAGDDLFELAKRRFEKQARPLVRTGAEAEIVWRWLCRRQRVVILVDDIDQIGFDGEPGFMMRRLLEEVADEGQAVVSTARPAGVPAGIAASAISLEPLGFETAVEIVARPAKREPGANVGEAPPRGRIERWIEGGNLTEAPLYLEALAELTAVGACPDLPSDPKRWADGSRPGRRRKISERREEWSPLWVRYLLLDCFYERVLDGSVRRSQAIDSRDRKRSLRALEGAALGMLGATGLEAKATVEHGDQPEQCRQGRPKRRRLADFLTVDDRRGMDAGRENGGGRRTRPEVSQHEAIDTGERLRVLDRDSRGYPQFRHRIMQAFLAGRCLARIGRQERTEGASGTAAKTEVEERSKAAGFDWWVGTLTDRHHPEKLTAHLTLVFAAIRADDLCVCEHDESWDGLGDEIARRLIKGVEDPVQPSKQEPECEGPADRADQIDPKRLDPTTMPDFASRNDPDDNLIKLTTAANIVATIGSPDAPDRATGRARKIVEGLEVTAGAMRWTKLEAVPAIAVLGGLQAVLGAKPADDESAWLAIWTIFAGDTDYDVRRAASQQLERDACCAYPLLADRIDRRIWRAGSRAAEGEPVQFKSEGDDEVDRSFTALGWILPAIVSGLSEELEADAGSEDPGNGSGGGRPGAGGDGGPGGDGSDPGPIGPTPESLRRARLQLERLTTLAHEGGRHQLEESLAQGFKADAMHQASEPSRRFSGAGWVASNRKLVADVALPHAESWYARMLLDQALAMYSIAGIGHDDTFDVIAYQLRPTRERHPLVKQAIRLARAALYRGKLRRERWKAFIWGDDVEDADRLPTVLGRRATQLVGDVALLVALKEGSPSHRHGNFGHMEQLPYCLSASRDRYEILGTGCPPHCGWGFCPYRTSSPDEPSGHRGIGRGFSRGQRRQARRQRRPPWQRRISRKRLQKFWQQMEYKARR